MAWFGPNYEWDARKLKQKSAPEKSVPHSILMQPDKPETPVFAVQSPVATQKIFAMILTGIKSADNAWFDGVLTLVDSCGCENGINAVSVYSNGFQIFNNLSMQVEISTLSVVLLLLGLRPTHTHSTSYLLHHLWALLSWQPHPYHFQLICKKNYHSQMNTKKSWLHPENILQILTVS